ncbi:hypothetical protein AB0M39_12600 [Streptomyces sp. NPDC051907]|uniref:hypothetical protein n=1 Tax=Streptomyces sp. NPDC051907 TaxID=3155284 RepID=UPI0034449DA0
MAAIPLDLLDQIRTLQRDVRALMGRVNIRPALDEITAGRVKIGEGGSLEVYAPDGTGIFGVGRTADGSYGVEIQRPDGSNAFTVGGTGEGSNMIRTWSRVGDVILMDDYHSPRFLGRPWMPVPLYPTKQQGTTSSTYQYGWVGGAPAHNAVMVLNISSFAGPGGGQVRVNMLPPSGGSVEVAEYDIPANKWTDKTIVKPLNGVGFLEYVGWNIAHRAKTDGTAVETRVFTAYTRNTFTAAEAPAAPAGAAAAEHQPLGAPIHSAAPSTRESAADRVEPGLRTIDD